MIRYARANGSEPDVWELGNEINAFWHLYGIRSQISAETYLEDLSKLRDVLAKSRSPSRVAGPSSAFWPIIGEPLGILFGMMASVVPRSKSLLDIVSWHYYPTQSERCPIYVRRAQPHSLIVLNHLNEIIKWAKQVEDLVTSANAGQEVWLGETGPAQCGGAEGISSSWISGFWWLDQLGTIAARGHKVVVRQTLIGSDYGVDPEKVGASARINASIKSSLV